MATTTYSAITSREAASPSIPPLENGDRLSRDEFERRYDAMPHLKKAELIEGVVYIPFAPLSSSPEGVAAMSSPVSATRHGDQHLDLSGLIVMYRSATPGVRGSDNATIRLDLDNMPQPDLLLYIHPDCGGQANITEDGYIEGGPELVAEVASSSVSYDLHAKLNVYRRNGVREYIVWRVRDDVIDWFVLRGGQYERLTADEQGRYRSEVFPGLWLDPSALISGDLTAMFQFVNEGIATPEHAAFVDRLRQAAGGHQDPR